MFNPYAEWQDVEDNADFLLSQNFGYNLLEFATQLELYAGSEIVETLAADGLLEKDYTENLSPIGYRYANPEIGRLAHTIGRLLLPRVHATTSARSSAAKYLYRERQIYAHMTRILRLLVHEPQVCEMIGEAQRKLETEKASLARFNYAMFQHCLALAKAGQDVPFDMAEPIESRYIEALERARSIEESLARNLARCGQDWFAVPTPPLM